MRDYSDEYKGPEPDIYETPSDNRPPRPSKSRRSRRKLPPLEPSPFEIMLDQPIRKSDGAILSIDDALMHKTVQDALEGKRAAINEVVTMLIVREEIRAEFYARNAILPGVEWVFEEHSFTAYRAMDVLGILRRVPSGHGDYLENKLADWVIESGLKKLETAEPLSRKEMHWVKVLAVDANLPAILEAEADAW